MLAVINMKISNELHMHINYIPPSDYYVLKSSNSIKTLLFFSCLQVSIVPYDTASSNKSSAVICGLCTIPLDGDVINRLVDDLDCCCDSTLVKSPINTMEKPKFSSSLCAITKFYTFLYRKNVVTEEQRRSRCLMLS